jgi:hypothetical protein
MENLTWKKNNTRKNKDGVYLKNERRKGYKEKRDKEKEKEKEKKTQNRKRDKRAV